MRVDWEDGGKGRQGSSVPRCFLIPEQFGICQEKALDAGYVPNHTWFGNVTGFLTLDSILIPDYHKTLNLSGTPPWGPPVEQGGFVDIFQSPLSRYVVIYDVPAGPPALCSLATKSAGPGDFQSARCFQRRQLRKEPVPPPHCALQGFHCLSAVALCIHQNKTLVTASP